MDPVKLLDAAKIYVRGRGNYLLEVGWYICDYYNRLRERKMFSYADAYTSLLRVHITYNPVEREYGNSMKLFPCTFSMHIAQKRNMDAQFLLLIKKAEQAIVLEDYILSDVFNNAPPVADFSMFAIDETLDMSKKFHIIKTRTRELYVQWGDMYMEVFLLCMTATIEKDFSVRIVVYDPSEQAGCVFLHWISRVYEYFEGHPDVKVAT